MTHVTPEQAKRHGLEVIIEHGEWCRNRCSRGSINQQRIDEIVAETKKELKAL